MKRFPAWGSVFHALSALVLAACVAQASAEAPAAPVPVAAAPTTQTDARTLPLAAIWRDLASGLDPAMAASRRLLLGRRDPNGASCVSPDADANYFADSSGGVGSGSAYIYYESLPRRASPKADFVWQQTELNSTLRSLARLNQPILPQMTGLAQQAAQLARGLEAATAWPEGLAPAGVGPRDQWPGYCLHRLDRAMADRDLAGARCWASELAAALFALGDLHRWLAYLVENQLAALDFQAKCKTLFEDTDEAFGGAYAPMKHISAFPAGRLIKRGLNNYLELERQAERLYRVPQEFLAAGPDGAAQARRAAVAAVPAAVWMPPDLRDAFVRLRGQLSPANQQAWDQAAHQPFDRSYLANMLYRASRVDTVDDLAVVLQRFNRITPDASRSALMDTLFYRGGDLLGGCNWADRFDPRLMDAAGALGGTPEQTLLGAQHFTRAVFGSWDNYTSGTTLAKALTDRKLDCLVATDMVGSLYRNAGRAGFYNVRWCAGTSGHSVAAAEVKTPTGSEILIVDGLDQPETSADHWPEAYLRGHEWPAGLPGRKPDLYAVELYVRGIDNYVWVEGYIIRGPNAGMLMSTSVPYLPNRAEPRSVHVHPAAGPAKPPRDG